ncbi:MAG: hypothetical protein WA117_19450 [Verrucomicrobiia bacterium]
MRIVCIKNTLAAIAESEVRERLRRSIHMDGPITDLEIGREYAVQAVEERDGGLWFYLHTVSVNDYPYPYPAEMFELRDNTVPAGWVVSMEVQRGSVGLKRITFPAWATDDVFYERLVDGDVETVSAYRRWMARE